MSVYNWHTMEIEDVIEKLNSSLKGITRDEARKRFNEYGPNELVEKKKKTAVIMFLDQFKDFMILILIGAAIISGFIGELSDTIAIIVIVVINAIIGFIQEYRAEKALEALKKMAAYNANVIRDGVISTIPASELVPGDVVVLEAGQIVPADIRLMEAVNLKIEEAALTGESVPVEKQHNTLTDESVPLGDRKNMAFKGTVVSYGRGSGIVVATGMNTELGKIASMLQGEEEAKTPLQKRLMVFGKKLAIAVLAICAIVFGFGVFRGEPVLLMLLTAISLAVAAIPEAMPAVVTISLALGAKKLVKLNTLIRKLPAVETLGSVTYICSDKTGTLTQNKMTVEKIFIDDNMISVSEIGRGDQSSLPKELFFIGLALSNDAKLDKEGNIIGDPTETALYKAARSNGYHKEELEKIYPRILELPFDSERKCMTTFHRWKDSSYISFTKGAIDTLMERSINIHTKDGILDIDTKKLKTVNELMADEGLRVLCIAYRMWDKIPEEFTSKTVETGLTVLGLTGMMDPPREEVKDAVFMCKNAGIVPVMITGDHPITAKTIARRLGILDNGHDAIITGSELDALTLAEFEERVENIRVYARVAPEQKLKIVRALQDKGHFVAMTGDGVNDAPALKRADIGIAMGITGTDVSKEAAHMVLLDDNFATIVKAVKEGRKIYDNIRKFIKYLLTTNSGEIWTLFLAPVLGLPIPLLPIHILWINLVTDGLPALALSTEPEEEDVMNRPPRDPKESLFAHGLGFHAIWVGLLMAVVVLSTQAWSIKTGNCHWQTMVFTVLCLTQLGHVLAIRSEKASLFKMGIFSNKYLFGAVILTFILQMATIYIPALNRIFKTEPLTFNELLLTLILSSIVFFAVEIEKMIKRKKRHSGT